MRRSRYMFAVGLILLILGACNVSIKPAGIVIALGLLLLVGSARAFLGALNDE